MAAAARGVSLGKLSVAQDSRGVHEEQSWHMRRRPAEQCYVDGTVGSTAGWHERPNQWLI